jgi:hypothetical protein
VTGNPIGQTNAFQSILTFGGIMVVIFVITIVSLLLFRKHRKLISQNKPTFEEKSIN